MLHCLNILWLPNQMKQLYFHVFALMAIHNEHPCLSAGGGRGVFAHWCHGTLGSTPGFRTDASPNTNPIWSTDLGLSYQLWNLSDDNKSPASRLNPGGEAGGEGRGALGATTALATVFPLLTRHCQQRGALQRIRVVECGVVGVRVGGLDGQNGGSEFNRCPEELMDSSAATCPQVRWN